MDYGGDSRTVQYQLKSVQQIQASYAAFAATLTDGSVVTWGNADFGGDSRGVQDQLKGVQQIQASFSASGGGDSRAVLDQLKACSFAD